MKINDREIVANFPPYLVAELSANHNGSLQNALKAIETAKNAGADAVKIQTYEPDALTIDCDREDFKIKSGLWSGKTLYHLYKEAYTPYSWHKTLFEHAAKVGVTIFSTPFDTEGVELLKSLNAPAYKIASFEMIDLELIKAVAQTKKPLIISTGMASENEIEEAIETAKSNGAKDIILLHCVSEYPAPIEAANIRTISYLSKRFHLPIGLSDHSLSNSAAIAATSLGAVMIEKHFTLDRSADSPDSAFSIDLAGFLELRKQTNEVWKTLGIEAINRSQSEMKSLVFRRSLYAVKDIKKGEKFNRQNTRSIRPGYGLAPREIERVLRSVANCDISRGTALTNEMVKEI